MTARLEAGFRRRFRDLLALVRPRRLDFGVDLLMGRGRDLAEREALPLARALARVYELTRVRVKKRVEVTGACAIVHPPWDRPRDAPAPSFLCDPGLGELARGLRAAGYEAGEGPGPEALLAAPHDPGLVFLTADADFVEGPGTEGRCLWLPSALPMEEQLAMVFGDLGLPPRT
jgi:hypothetical protein